MKLAEAYEKVNDISSNVHPFVTLGFALRWYKVETTEKELAEFFRSKHAKYEIREKKLGEKGCYFPPGQIDKMEKQLLNKFREL